MYVREVDSRTLDKAPVQTKFKYYKAKTRMGKTKEKRPA